MSGKHPSNGNRLSHFDVDPESGPLLKDLVVQPSQHQRTYSAACRFARGRRARPLTGGICAAVLLFCAGCATAREPISAVDAASATIPGYVGVRTWADEKPERLARMLRSPRFAVTATHDVNFLAPSGGGAAGSFSAGALKGWTSTAQRPEFDIVSGVSTGALIAPFAFLGSDYDDLLEALYTGDTARGLAEPQSPFKIASTGGIVDPEPLRQVVERYATQPMLDRIAEEHRKGRRLVVVTTNLDQQRAVL